MREGAGSGTHVGPARWFVKMVFMVPELPREFMWRRPAQDDAEAIFAVIGQHNTPLLGSPDITLVEVRDELSEPGFDPDSDAWLVSDDAGVDVAYGWACRKGTSDQVDIDVYADDNVAGWLWAQVLARARALGAAAGHGAISVDIGIYQNDEAQQARARARGFTPVTTFQRMRIDFDGPPTEPVVPAAVVVRTGPGDEVFRRHAHHVSTRAFVDHFGFVERSFEEWHQGIEAATTSDWAQVRVAYVDGEAAAMVRGSDQFVDDQQCGYVTTVAVLPAARGRGLAKLLLQQAFAADFRRGRCGTILHVDANNVTPALDLYRHVGMRTVLAVDVWRAQSGTT
jgi:mycothiol synthase